MKKKFLFLCLFCVNLLICNAQEEIKHHKLDTLCAHFVELLAIDFDVTQKAGCEFLITELVNNSTPFPEDSLSYQWNVFQEDSVVFFDFNEESPDVFLHNSGNYHITLIITNLYGCTDTLTKLNVISIDTMPQINFSFTPENALFAEYFGEVEFTNLTDSALLTDTTVTWYWDFGDDVMNTTIVSPVHLFSTWGDYHTTFHLQTQNGCKVALTKTVTIEEELFFPDTLKTNSQTFPSVFAVTNLNTHIPQDAPDEFRTNHLYIYNAKGKLVYEQQNYDTYIKNNVIMQGFHAFNANGFPEGTYYYSFYYKGKSKMVYYGGEVFID